MSINIVTNDINVAKIQIATELVQASGMIAELEHRNVTGPGWAMAIADAIKAVVAKL